MRTPDIDSILQGILNNLRYNECPVSAKTVAEALTVPLELTEDALEFLCLAGLVIQQETADVETADYRYMTIPAANTVTEVIAEHKILWYETEQLVAQMLRQICLLGDDVKDTAKELLFALYSLRKRLVGVEERRRFAQLLLHVMGLVFYAPELNTDTALMVHDLLPEDYNDPTFVQLRAAQIIVQHRAGWEQNEQFLADSAGIFEHLLADTPDDSNTAFSLLLAGCLYYMNGEHGRLLELHERYSLRPLEGFFFWHDLFNVHASNAALHCGRFPLSLGIIESFRNTAEITGSSRQSLFWRLHLCFLLLHMDRLREALPHIDHVLTATRDVNLRFVSYVGNRALALYHYKSGRPDAAARLLSSDGEQARARGETMLPITDPVMLDMLYDLETRLKLPITGYELDSEIQRIEQGSNRLLRGVVARLRGLIARASGKSEAALEAFRHSFQDLLHTGNYIQCLRTGMELELELQEGELHAERQRFAERLERLRQVHGTTLGGDSPDSGTASIRRCLVAFSAMPIGGSDETLSRLMAIVRRELSAQRVVLVRGTSYGGFECAAASNLTPVELDGEAFRDILHRLRMRFSQVTPESPLLWQRRENGGMAVGLAVFVSAANPWLLYMDNTLGTGNFMDMSPDTACLLCAVLAAEIRSTLSGRNTDRCKGEVPAVAPETSRMSPLFGESMRAVLDDAERVAETSASVLILGETGVGKEILARHIHECSGCIGPFVPVHLACVSEHLFESELFGHEKGSFTGAIRAKTGLMELAHQGVLFLDEVGDMPMAFQIKLLRFLQEREFLRVGGVQRIRADFRLITATNRDLREEVRQGRFREDLYYRLAVIPLHIPPLRQRRDDILPLAQAFRRHFTAMHQRPEHFPTDAQLIALVKQDWPGNIRELQSVVEGAVVLGRLSYALEPQSRVIESEIFPVPSLNPTEALPHELSHLLQDYPTAAALQRQYIRLVLDRTGGKIYGHDGAAAILGMKKSTLYARLKELEHSAI